MSNSRIITGDCREVLASLPDRSVQCCITSPPYFGLRDYGHEGQIGLEPTPAEFVAKLVEVFREVRRVLREDGTLWLNLGDSYSSGGRKTRDPGQSKLHPAFTGEGNATTNWRPDDGAKPKDLIGIPWRVAFALQADGWYLRQDIIWHKPNPMPESVTDRCTKAHEYIFLLSKSERYYFDGESVKEPAKVSSKGIRFGGSKYGDSSDPKHATKSGNVSKEYEKANKRSVWSVNTKPFKGAHFATFPTELVLPCVLAGCPAGGTVLDPFNGAGTTGLVALSNGRNYVGVELNPEYVEITRQRLGLLAQTVAFEEHIHA
jgi:site-specific DNA-methyltransferase (adenine-specific)